MSDTLSRARADGAAHIREAVYQDGALTAKGFSERLFARLFSGLVYAQIWEDPEVDMEALALGEGHRVVTIASGGCNLLAYLTRGPARIDAVDLNPAHIALNRMKIAAFRHLPQHGDLLRFFGGDGHPHNPAAYDAFVAPHLDAATRRYWEGRDLYGRRRIAVFRRNFYRTGLLGRFIALGHALARLHGVDPAGIMAARTPREQRRFFDEQLKPLFDRPVIRWAASRRASLFGLGIPPAQYDALVTAGDGTMTSVLAARLERLACHFPLRDNYFAWQAFARRYPLDGAAALPAYLDKRHYRAIRDRLDRVHIHHTNIADLIAAKPAGSVDRFVLLDAQDWMSPRQLDRLWAEITRAAAPGARVVFRTAATETPLPGRIDAETLSRWTYEGQRSREFAARDRSAIYGGFHLYVMAG